MKKQFQAYYRLPKKDLDDLWKDGLVVPDANTLLNLYRYSPTTRSELLKILRGLQNKLWVPYQSGYEFHRHRLSVIFEQHAKYDEALTRFKTLLTALESTRGHPFVAQQLWRRLERLRRDLERELHQNAEELQRFQHEDPILEELSLLFESRTGKSLTTEDLNALRAEGEKRYKKRIPPGFADERKPDDERYGDLIIWQEVLREAEVQKKGVIFVTDDGKDDWWWRVKGKTIGPLPALREEFYGRVGKPFHMYPPHVFMERAAAFLKRHVQKDAVEEIKVTRAEPPRTWSPAPTLAGDLSLYSPSLLASALGDTSALRKIIDDHTQLQSTINRMISPTVLAITDDQERLRAITESVAPMTLSYILGRHHAGAPPLHTASADAPLTPGNRSSAEAVPPETGTSQPRADSGGTE